MKSIKVLLMAGFIFSAPSAYATTEDLFSSNLREDAIIAETKAVDEVTEKFENLIKEVLNSDKTSTVKRAGLAATRQLLRIWVFICIAAGGRLLDERVNPARCIRAPKPLDESIGLSIETPLLMIAAGFAPEIAVLGALVGVAAAKGEYEEWNPGWISKTSEFAAVASLLASDLLIHSDDNVLESLKKLEKSIQEIQPEEKKKIKSLFKSKKAIKLFDKIYSGKEDDGILLAGARCGMASVDFGWALMIVMLGIYCKNPTFWVGGLADIAININNVYKHPNFEKGRVLKRIKASLA